MGAYDCDCINNLEYDRRERKQKEQSWSTVSTAQSTAQSTNLIDRQATIDAVNNAFDRETLLARFVRSIAVRAIRDMPSAQPEPQWIPVERELPKEPGYYITSNEYNGVGEDFYYDGHFWNADKNAYSVIAWMPKPEHYKPNK